MFNLQLERKIDTELASEIEKESAFVSELLETLTVDIENSKIVYTAKTNDPKQLKILHEKVNKFVTVMTFQHRPIESRVLVESARKNKSTFTASVLETLIKCDWLHHIGNGHVSLSGPPLRLFHAINDVITLTYSKTFAPQEHHYPAMIPAELLAKAGYFDSHPNNVTFVSHLHNDIDVIEDFRKKFGKAKAFPGLPTEAIAPPHICLNPAACLPCYFTYQNKVLKKNLCLSWVGRVFRNESSNLSGLERLWEYNVKELVFLGNTKFVAQSQERSIQVVSTIMKLLDLDFKIETSSDPFFATVASVKKFWQKSLETKYELKLPAIENQNGSFSDLAAGSINYHADFFGKNFNIISPNGQIAESACVGLGIERIILACFVQHGFNKSNWPKTLQKVIFI